MNRSAFVFLVIGVIVGLALAEAVSNLNTAKAPPSLTLAQSYQDAVKDAMYAEQSDICNNLTTMTPSNPDLIWSGSGSNRSVLVVTWTKYASSYPIGAAVNTSWGDTWVTVAPQIRSFFATQTSTANGNLTLRADQLLGLPPNASNTYFVELWVKPGGLFRPAYNNEINMTTEQLTFPSFTSSSYIQWFNSYIIYAYFTRQYPWTRLGYTYDWGNPTSRFGLSEFVIQQGSIVVVKSVTPTLDYLQMNSSTATSLPSSYPHCNIPRGS